MPETKDKEKKSRDKGKTSSSRDRKEESSSPTRKGKDKDKDKSTSKDRGRDATERRRSDEDSDSYKKSGSSERKRGDDGDRSRVRDTVKVSTKSKDKEKERDKTPKRSSKEKDVPAPPPTPSVPASEKKDKDKDKKSSKIKDTKKPKESPYPPTLSKDDKKSGKKSKMRDNSASDRDESDIEMGLSSSRTKTSRRGATEVVKGAIVLPSKKEKGVGEKSSLKKGVFGKSMIPSPAPVKEESDDSSEDDEDVGWMGRVDPKLREDVRPNRDTLSTARLEKALGSCTKCLYKYCGEGCTTWLIRRRFVLFRILICMVYFAIGVEYFHNREGWSRTQAVYFITVSTTTVGYGDLHPTTDATRLFTTIYVILGLAVVLSSANDVIQYFIVKKFQRKVLAFIDWIVKTYYVKCLKVDAKGSSIESKAWFKLVFSLSCVVALVFFGTTFYSTNEGLTIITALYWTVMTMLTVGYGDVPMKKPSTQVFSTWFIWLCVIIYIMAITNIWDTFEELKSEALRLEILKQHAVDIVDVLADEERKRKNTADKAVFSAGHGFDLFSIIKDGVTGAEERGEGHSSIRRNTIKQIRNSIKSGHFKPRASIFEGKNPMRGEDGTLLYNNDNINEVGIGGSHGDNPPPPPARPTTVGDREAANEMERKEETKRLQSLFVKADSLIPKDQVLEKAREDRFVLEMLEKINKQKYEREVEPLIVHFHKLEKLKAITTNNNVSKTEMTEELFAGSNSGGLMGFASSLIGNKKALVRKRASNFKELQLDAAERLLDANGRSRSSIMPTSSSIGSFSAGGVSPPPPGRGSPA